MIFDLEKIKTKMLVKYPFFGSIVCNVNYKKNNNVSTASTDGETIYYNLDYLNKLKVDEQIFILAHEICHIAFNHIPKSKNKNMKLWNIATDAVINQLLKKDGLMIIEGGVDIEEAINYDSEQFYELLLKENNRKRLNKILSIGGFNDERSIGHASHELWEGAVKKQELEHDKMFDIGETSAFSKNNEEKKKMLDDLKKSLYSQNNTKSDIEPNSREINEVGNSESLFDWRYYLKQSTKSNVDWSYKKASIVNGILRPKLEYDLSPEVEILLDTSGSINNTMLKNFIRECKNIMQDSIIKVGCFDTKFYGFNTIRKEEDIESMKFLGGGGTDFNVAVNAFSNRTQNKIIFTDGEASMPERAVNAIWVVFGEEKINPKGGKVIMVSKEDLEKLDKKVKIKYLRNN